MLGCIESGRRSIYSFDLSDEEWRHWRSRTKVLTIWAWSARFYPRVSHLPRIIGAFAPKAARSKSRTWISVVCVGSACLCVSAFRAPAAATKRVIILHSFGRDFKPWNEYAVNIRTELGRQSQWKLDIQDHSLMAARTDDEDPYVAFVGYLAALYAKDAPDLIVSIGAPAANFVQRYRKQLFPAVPMVFTGVEQRRIQWSSLTANDIVVAVAHDFPAQFQNILRILPGTKTIAVVNGASPNEKFWLGELQRETKVLQERIAFLWYEDASFEEILQRAAMLPPNSAIFWHLMNVDAAGVSHEGGNALARLFASANAAIFSFYDTFFGGEIVGGPMFSIAEDSRKAAAVAMRILDGEKPEDIKVTPQRYGTPKYDWRLLQRWDISEGNLPPGSQVLFRTLPLWQVYFWRIVLVGAIVFGQAGLIMGLLYERRRRVDAEMQARQRMFELAHVNRYSVAGELATSIAHELNQPLAAASNYLSAAKRLPVVDGSRATALVDKASQQILRAGEIIQRLRDFVSNGKLTRRAEDLGPVLKEAVALALMGPKHRGIRVIERVEPSACSALIDRIQIQQVLVNLIRNAAEAMDGSPRREITLATAPKEPGLIEASVADTGPGMPADVVGRLFEPFVTTKPDGMGVGLSICRTIIEAHGGHIGAEANPEGGTVSVTRDMSGFRSTRSVRFVPEGSHAAGGQNGPDHRCDWVASSEEAELRGGGGAVGHERAAFSPAARCL